jgi:hypothetical protein
LDFRENLFSVFGDETGSVYGRAFTAGPSAPTEQSVHGDEVDEQPNGSVFGSVFGSVSGSAFDDDEIGRAFTAGPPAPTPWQPAHGDEVDEQPNSYFSGSNGYFSGSNGYFSLTGADVTIALPGDDAATPSPDEYAAFHDAGAIDQMLDDDWYSGTDYGTDSDGSSADCTRVPGTRATTDATRRRHLLLDPRAPAPSSRIGSKRRRLLRATSPTSMMSRRRPPLTYSSNNSFLA